MSWRLRGRCALVCLGVVAASGCTSLSGKDEVAISSVELTQAFQGLSNKSLMALTSDEQEKRFDETFTKVMGICQPILSKYEELTEQRSWARFWVGTFGSLIGALGPAAVAFSSANAAWSSLTSGLSGVANSVQQGLDTEGLSGGEAARTRELIRQGFMVHIAIATNHENGMPKRITALYGAHASCVAYAVSHPGLTIKSPN